MAHPEKPTIRARAQWKNWHVVTIAILACFTASIIALGMSLPSAPAPVEAAGPLDKGTAASACMDAITPMLAQPRSADFHTFTDTTFHTDGMRARFTVGLTAKNGLGLPIDATAACVFEGETLTSAELLPAGS